MQLDSSKEATTTTVVMCRTSSVHWRSETNNFGPSSRVTTFARSISFNILFSPKAVRTHLAKKTSTADNQILPADIATDKVWDYLNEKYHTPNVHYST